MKSKAKSYKTIMNLFELLLEIQDDPSDKNRVKAEQLINDKFDSLLHLIKNIELLIGRTGVMKDSDIVDIIGEHIDDFANHMREDVESALNKRFKT